MNRIYAVFTLLLVLALSAQCQNSAGDLIAEGYELFMQGRYDEAAAAYDEALNIHPVDPLAWSFKCYTLNTMGGHDEAMLVCDRAIDLDPNSSFAWCSKALY